MIVEAKQILNTKEIIAETDDDAVKFYRKCGFITKKMPDQGLGVNRYLCTLK